MFHSVTPATRALILANVAVFLLEQVAMDPILRLFALWPLGPLFRPWQVLTYAFLHAGVLHIFFNMFALYMFAPALESYWGGRRFITYYLVCVLAAAGTQLIGPAVEPFLVLVGQQKAGAAARVLGTEGLPQAAGRAGDADDSVHRVRSSVLRSSSLAIKALCTSSGPSAMRSTRA